MSTTLSQVLSYARVQAQTDNNGLTDANGILFANEALADFHRKLIDRGVDASQLQEAYMSGVGNQGTYLYPTDMLFLKAIEANYSNTNVQDYKLATQVDVSNIPGQVSFSWLRQYADSLNPQFDDRGDWFELFPTPLAGNNLTNLIRIFYYLKPTEYISTSDTVAYPENMDIRTLAWRIAANYFYSLSKMVEGDAFNAKYEERVKEYISTLSRGSQQPIQATVLPITGWQY